MRQLKYVVQGKVQGVWFRASTRDKARELGLDGWVRNRPDGSVEAVARGDDARLAQFELWLHDGPPLARVEAVDVRAVEEDPGLVGFEVR